MASSPLECDICCNTYSDDHCPRILPCSHELCSLCIDELISTQKNECPICRKQFTANSAGDLMISRGLLDVAKQLSSTHGGSKASTSAPRKSVLEFTEDFRKNVTKKGITDLLATKVKINNRITSDSEMKDGLLESNKGIARHMQMMKKLQLSNENTLDIVKRNIKMMSTRLDSILQEEKKFCDVEARLKAAADFASAGVAMGEAGKILRNAEKTISETEQLLQENDRRRDDMRQDIFKIGMDLEAATKDLRRIIEELEGDSFVNITVTDLLSPHVCSTGDAQREIFTVMTFEGKLRVAPVAIQPNNQLYMNHLEEGRLPPRCFVIKLESLMQGSPSPSPSSSSSSPPRAFLDLTYESTHLGKIIIRVFENCMMGLNFLYMCAGGMGPCYANSQVSRVFCEGGAYESVEMGAYVSRGGGGGTSTQAVLSSREEDWRRERNTKREEKTYEKTLWQAGEVRGNIAYECASNFWIVTRDHPYHTFGYCFGEVEEGLDVLREAILKYPDYKKIKVAQCGLIL